MLPPNFFRSQRGAAAEQASGRWWWWWSRRRGSRGGPHQIRRGKGGKGVHLIAFDATAQPLGLCPVQPISGPSRGGGRGGRGQKTTTGRRAGWVAPAARRIGNGCARALDGLAYLAGARLHRYKLPSLALPGDTSHLCYFMLINLAFSLSPPPLSPLVALD